MSRLIDVDAAIDRYYAEYKKQDIYDGSQDRDWLKRCIDEAPTIEAEPVRHGQWISLTECANEGVYCSICKKKVWKSDYALCSHKSRNKLRSYYCPNCGAKMDGGADDVSD